MFSMFGAEGLVSVLGLVRNGARKGRGQPGHGKPCELFERVWKLRKGNEKLLKNIIQKSDMIRVTF